VLPQTTYHYHVTLLRHAQSEGNARGILQGQSDFPLSEIGIQQAEALAHRWKKEHQHFDCIISSPLSRAQQTAEIIAAALGAPLELDDNWMERNNGQRSTSAAYAHRSSISTNPLAWMERASGSYSCAPGALSRICYTDHRANTW
jgi:broad specificity phosphatase PhoE